MPNNNKQVVLHFPLTTIPLLHLYFLVLLAIVEVVEVAGV